MRRRKVLIVAVTVFSTLLSDFVGGRIYHRFDTARRTELREIKDEERTLREKSPVYHHGLVAKGRARAMWGPLHYDLITNSLGFKDATTRDVSIARGRHRVVFIGDSFTEGLGINYEETFVGIVGAELEARGIEVLNAGVISYSPIIYLRRVQHLLDTVGLEFDELIVFLDISDIQDETLYHLDENSNVKKIDDEEKDGKREDDRVESRWVRFKRMLRQNSIVFQSATQLRWRLVSDHRAERRRQVLHGERSGWTVDDSVFEDYGRKGLEIADRNLTSLLELLRSRDIAMTMAVYPWPQQIHHRDLDSRQVAYWKKWCADNRVPFQNYFPYFMDGRDPERVIAQYFIPGDVHWNHKGHRLMAEGFFSHWRRRPPVE